MENTEQEDVIMSHIVKKYGLSFILVFSIFKETTSHTLCSCPRLSKGYSQRKQMKYLSLIPVGI